MCRVIFDNIEKPELANLLDFFQPGLNLELARVFESFLEPGQNSFFFVFTSTNDERKSEFVPISEKEKWFRIKQNLLKPVSKTDPSQDSSVGSISAWYRGNPGSIYVVHVLYL